MEEERTSGGGGGLGASLKRIFSSTRGRLLLIGGAMIILFIAIRHSSQRIATAPATAVTGADGVTRTTINVYEPTIQSGGSSGGGGGGGGATGGGGSGGGGGGLVAAGSWNFSQWLAEIKQYGSHGERHPRWLSLIEQDPNLTAGQRGSLGMVLGSGVRNPHEHPGGGALERLTPVQAHPFA